MTRTLEEIRADRDGRETLGHLITVVQAKLALISQLGLFEYEAVDEGFLECAEAFRRVAASERVEIDTLLNLIADQLPQLTVGGP